MEFKQFQSEWNIQVHQKNDKKIYSLLLYFFRQVLPNLKNASNTDEGFQILSLIHNILNQLLEKNYEKSSHLRHILSDIYTTTFQSKSILDDPNSISMYLNPEEKKNSNNPDEIIPIDSQGSDFFKGKIRELFDENLIPLFVLYSNENLPIRDQLTDLIIHLIDIFPDGSETLIQSVLIYYDLDKINHTEFTKFLKKMLDKEPSPIIFAVVTQVQEIMLDNSVSTKNIEEIEIIFEIFAEYVEYYPDYFSEHINLFIGLIGRYSDRLSLSVAKILLYYAKRGQEAIDELFFDLYTKLNSLSKSVQKEVIKILHEAIFLGGVFIMENYFRENGEFDKNLRKLISKNLHSSFIELQELSYELSIALWKFEIHLNLPLGEKNKPYPKNFIQKLMKPIITLINQLIESHLYSPYLFMTIVQNIDQIYLEILSDYPIHQFEEIYLTGSNLDTQKKYFETVKKFLDQLNQK